MMAQRVRDVKGVLGPIDGAVLYACGGRAQPRRICRVCALVKNQETRLYHATSQCSESDTDRIWQTSVQVLELQPQIGNKMRVWNNCKYSTFSASSILLCGYPGTVIGLFESDGLVRNSDEAGFAKARLPSSGGLV